MSIEELAAKAVKKWGREMQFDMVIEECAELINAIQKWRRGRVDIVAVLEEGVDVELMIEQLKMMIEASELWENVKQNKMERLEKLLTSEANISCKP